MNEPTGARRRDPAPTRAAYRMQRLWLTPLFRFALRAGLPVLVCAALFGWAVSNPQRTEALAAELVALRVAIEERPEFQVTLMSIEGGSDELVADIHDVLPLDLPVSSFHLDIEAMQQVVAGLDAVKSAAISVQPGGVLRIAIEERQPVIVWQTRNELSLLDETGHRVAPIEARAAHAELPLLVGRGAQANVPEALELLQVLAPIASRVVGLQRIGERRWDVVLTGDVRIKLPEAAPRQALEEVMALDAARDVFARQVRTVDMRLPDRTTLQLQDDAVSELWRIRALSTSGAGQ